MDDDLSSFLDAFPRLRSRISAPSAVLFPEPDDCVEDCVPSALPALPECRVPTLELGAEHCEPFFPHGNAAEDAQFRAQFRANLIRRLLTQGPFSLVGLPNVNLRCHGVYALYYHGELAIYEPIRSPASTCPVYIGESSYYQETASSRNLYTRLMEHRQSLDQAGLGVENFTYRFVGMPVEWADFAESILIRSFRPLWNVSLIGFGNRSCRTDNRLSESTSVSKWDTLHAGRKATGRRTRDLEQIEEMIKRDLPSCVRAYHETLRFLTEHG